MSDDDEVAYKYIQHIDADRDGATNFTAKDKAKYVWRTLCGHIDNGCWPGDDDCVLLANFPEEYAKEGSDVVWCEECLAHPLVALIILKDM